MITFSTNSIVPLIIIAPPIRKYHHYKNYYNTYYFSRCFNHLFNLFSFHLSYYQTSFTLEIIP
nr:MAG TPA: hypothetical protein [Caudoviricetes sp.]